MLSHLSVLMCSVVQVAEYYQSVLMVLESDVGAAVVKKFKDWPKLLQIKTIYYTSIAHVIVPSSSSLSLSLSLPLLFPFLSLPLKEYYANE